MKMLIQVVAGVGIARKGCLRKETVKSRMILISGLIRLLWIEG